MKILVLSSDPDIVRAAENYHQAQNGSEIVLMNDEGWHVEPREALVVFAHGLMAGVNGDDEVTEAILGDEAGPAGAAGEFARFTADELHQQLEDRIAAGAIIRIQACESADVNIALIDELPQNADGNVELPDSFAGELSILFGDEIDVRGRTGQPVLDGNHPDNFAPGDAIWRQRVMPVSEGFDADDSAGIAASPEFVEMSRAQLIRQPAPRDNPSSDEDEGGDGPSSAGGDGSGDDQTSGDETGPGPDLGGESGPEGESGEEK